MQSAWELTQAQWATHLSAERRRLIDEYNAGGCLGFPPTSDHNSIYNIIALGERAGFDLPDQADELLKTPYHKLSVMVALAEGEPVPAEVLSQYPILAERS